MTEENPYADREPGTLTDEERADIRRRIAEMLTPENVEKLRRVTQAYVKASRRRQRRRAALRVLGVALVAVTIIVLGWFVFFA